MSQVDGEAQKREETNETFQKCIETFETETTSPAERHWKQRSYYDVIIRNMFICYAGKKRKQDTTRMALSRAHIQPRPNNSLL